MCRELTFIPNLEVPSYLLSDRAIDSSIEISSSSSFSLCFSLFEIYNLSRFRIPTHLCGQFPLFEFANIMGKLVEKLYFPSDGICRKFFWNFGTNCFFRRGWSIWYTSRGP